MADFSELILEELQGLRKDVTDGFSETKQRITAIETHTDPFFANGGGKEVIEADIKDLQRSKYIVLGGAGVLSTALHWMLKRF